MVGIIGGEEVPDDVLLMAVEQVAHLLQVSTRTVWRLVSAGKLVAPVYVGKAARWRYRDLKQWIEAGCPLERGER